MSFRFETKLNVAKDWHSWDPFCDAMLAIGVNKHGFGSWKGIREDLELGINTKIFDGEKGSDGKDMLPKPPHIARRMEYLFKVLREEDKRAKAPKLTFKFSQKADRATPEILEGEEGAGSDNQEDLEIDDKPLKPKKETANGTSGSKKANSDDDAFESPKKKIKIRPPKDPQEPKESKESKEKGKHKESGEKKNEHSKEKEKRSRTKEKTKEGSKSSKPQAGDGAQEEALDEKAFKECQELMRPVEVRAPSPPPRTDCLLLENSK